MPVSTVSWRDEESVRCSDWPDLSTYPNNALNGYRVSSVMKDPVCILDAGSRQELRILYKPDSVRFNSEEVLSPCKSEETTTSFR